MTKTKKRNSSVTSNRERRRQRRIRNQILSYVALAVLIVGVVVGIFLRSGLSQNGFRRENSRKIWKKRQNPQKRRKLKKWMSLRIQ